jgi:cell wall-associated NlpC family hydrolase
MKTRIFLFLLFFSLIALTVVVQGATTAQSAIIKGNGVNFRSEPGFGNLIIAVLQQGLPVAVIEQTDQWYKVQLSDGQTGWIYRQFIEVKSITSLSGGNFTSLSMDELLTYAKSFLEIKYVYGGDSPLGFDCSGFTMYVFAKFGMSLPHEADLQIAAGTEVPDKEELLPGDLVFFKTEGSAIVNHVGIYVGDNRFIGASSGYGAVRISPLDSGYYFDCYVGGRRLGIDNGEDR